VKEGEDEDEVRDEDEVEVRDEGTGEGTGAGTVPDDGAQAHELPSKCPSQK